MKKDLFKVILMLIAIYTNTFIHITANIEPYWLVKTFFVGAWTILVYLVLLLIFNKQIEKFD